MAAELVPDALWSLIRPLSQLQWRSRKVVDPCTGILSVTPKWHSLADDAETIGLRFWHDMLRAFTRLAACRNLGLTHFVLLNWLSRDGQIDWSHSVVENRSTGARAFNQHRRRWRTISSRWKSPSAARSRGWRGG